MRISQINAVYGIGSTGNIVKDLQHICKENGIDCEVICTSFNEFDPDVFLIGNQVSNKLHSLLSRIGGMQGYYSIFPTLKLLNHYKNYPPDIIHLHNLHSSYINLPMLLRFAAKNNLPVVVTLHDCWLFTGGCTHYEHSHCFKWKNSCGYCPQRFEEFPALLLDMSSKILADRVKYFAAIKNLFAVGVSQWIVDEARQKVFQNAACTTIHNGIDTDFFHPIRVDRMINYTNLRELKEKVPDIFFILCPANKWFLDINRDTFDYFASRLEDNMRMLFIGNGVDKARLTENMIDLGFVSSRFKIRDIYNISDVMVNCTREESLSLLNVEVQSCGTPVITYNNTGVKETVNGICSFAVENGNPEAAWKALMMIRKKGKEHYSTACRNWATQEFNLETNYRKYLDLYKSITRK